MPIKRLRGQHRTQTRVEIDREWVYYLHERLVADGQLEPILICRDKTGDWLAKGFHRVEAYLLAGHARIPACIMPGGRVEALEINASADDVLQKTIADRKFAAAKLLSEPKHAKSSSRQIAKLCHLDHETVEAVRRELESGGEIATSNERVGCDGKTYQVADSVSRIIARLPAAVQAKCMEALEQGLPLPPEAPQNLGAGVKHREKLMCCERCSFRTVCPRGCS